ncbi:MAG: hypothetical protein ACI4VP_04410 [Clostridia bacterium]
MEKHSEEKQEKKINLKKELIAVLVIILLVFGINLVLSHRNVEEQQKNTGIKTSKTIEGEKLVIKSTSEYNRIIEYNFENNVLKTVKMYEQFEDKDKFEEKKNNYEKVDNIEIINTNEKKLSIEIEKKDFGSDTGMSYEQIYDKYLVQIIGAYQIIQ